MEKETLYKELKPLLLSLAYHTLGSYGEAEDIVQDVFLTWEEKPPQGVRDVKAYLCRMVHNRCVDHIRASSRSREAYVGPWLPEPVDSAAMAQQDPAQSVLWKEALSSAGLLLLQQLSATERIVFLLREAYQYRFAEIAAITGKSVANCRQIYHRSKKSIGRLPERSPDAVKKNSDLAERFSEALMAGNIGQLLELLSTDAVMYMDGGGKVKAALRPIAGADKIVRFFLGIRQDLPPAYVCEVREISGWPGVRLAAGGITFAVATFHLAGDRISQLYIVNNPEKLGHCNFLENPS